MINLAEERLADDDLQLPAQKLDTLEVEDAKIDMVGEDFPVPLALEVARVYGKDWREGLRREVFGPYALAHRFKAKWPTADEIAQRVFEIDERADVRIASGAFSSLLQTLNDGHCYDVAHTVYQGTCTRLRVPAEAVRAFFEQFDFERECGQFPFIREEKRIWLAWLYRDEKLVASIVRRLAVCMPLEAQPWAPHDDVQELTPEQAEAVMVMQSAPIGVVTGFPGTGKSTSLKEACMVQNPGTTIALCAPTGKAAQRMVEVTHRPASTIHRLLEFNPQRGFMRGPGNPLDEDLVIVDEASMLDIRLAARLLSALKPEARIIFVGDVNQLPPVGPGAFFRDLITSKAVPVVRLQTVHRHAAGSWVAVNAPKILKGEPAKFEDCEDFEFYETSGPADGLGDVVCGVIDGLNKSGLDPHDRIVLTSRKTEDLPGSTHDLNAALQARFNPPGYEPEVELYGRTLRVGDRVIQTRNNYDLGVMNGDLGLVRNLGFERGKLVGAEIVIGDTSAAAMKRFNKSPLTVRGTRAVFYSPKDLRALQLGYALTIHKFQGSQAPVVIVVCHSVHGIMLTRKLLYTALTRAQKKVILIGDDAGVKRALAVTRDDSRRTKLEARLCA